MGETWKPQTLLIMVLVTLSGCPSSEVQTTASAANAQDDAAQAEREWERAQQAALARDRLARNESAAITFLIENSRSLKKAYEHFPPPAGAVKRWNGTDGYGAVTIGASTSDPSRRFWLTTGPLFPGTTGNRYFFVNHEGRVHASQDPITVLDLAKCSVPPGLTPVESEELAAH